MNKLILAFAALSLSTGAFAMTNPPTVPAPPPVTITEAQVATAQKIVNDTAADFARATGLSDVQREAVTLTVTRDMKLQMDFVFKAQREGSKALYDQSVVALRMSRKKACDILPTC